ncbi:hypothetical protein BDFG_09457, partial [Blastomyces dermatitidis ATCC 26199]
SSHIDRFTFTDDSEPDVESLIENLKNILMKKLLMLYITESSTSLSISSTASFPATSSQSSTLISVSDSLTLSTSVPATSTLTTSGFITSAFITSSSHFKKMLHRLNELYLSIHILSLFLSTLRIIY